jgi:hypothetical protein
MFRFNNLSVSTKLTVVVALFGVGLLASGWVSYRTVSRVKVNGPLYAEIVRGKDLVADILPPPEYIIETYLVVLQLTHERDPASRAALVERCAALRKDYDARHAYWQRELADGPMKEALLVNSYRPAVEFFDLWTAGSSRPWPPTTRPRRRCWPTAR